MVEETLPDSQMDCTYTGRETGKGNEAPSQIRLGEESNFSVVVHSIMGEF